MGIRLFTFAYNTLMTRANDNSPGNRLFLPTALSSMKDGNKPYLPLHVENWNLQNIKEATDISNDLATMWWNALWVPIYDLSVMTSPEPPDITQQMIDDATAAVDYITGKNLIVIAYPDSGPDLIVNNLEIQGLANVKVSSIPPTVTVGQGHEGYTATITLTANAYQTTDAWSQNLALAGTQQGTDSKSSQSFLGLNFSLKQCLCFVHKDDDNSTPVAPPPTLHLPASPSCSQYGFACEADGIALLNISNAEIVANIQITVSPDGKTLQVTLQSLALKGVQGANPNFSLTNHQFTNLTPIPFSNIDPSIFYDIWTSFFEGLLASEYAAAMLTVQINDALNAQGNLTQVQNLLNQQLGKVFDTIFGSTQIAQIKADPNTNAVDEYLFNRTRAALNDQKSYMYVPTLALGCNSPTIEPYTAGNLCIAGPYSTSILGVQVSISNIQLSKLTINGLSNVIAPANLIVFSDNPKQASANLLLAKLNPGPTLTVNGQQRTVPSPPLQASTPFSLSVQVEANSPVAITGTLNLSLQNQSGTLGVDTTLSASGDTQDHLQLTYTNITLVAAGTDDVEVSVKLDNDTGGFSNFVSEVISQLQVIEAILSALNTYISQHLTDISGAATTFAKNALNNIGK